MLNKPLLIRGKYVLTDARKGSDGILKDGAVLTSDETIVQVGDYEELRRLYPEAEVIGGGTEFVMPGVIDAHSHGRGISYVQKGIPYDFLENNIFDWMGCVNLPEELDAPLMAIKHLRNGSTSIHVNISVNPFDETAYERAGKLIGAYEASGIRLAYSPGMKDINALANDDEDFYKTLPKDLQEVVRSMVYFDKAAAQDFYVDLFSALRKEYHKPLTNVILGPFWAHGCTEQFYEKLRDTSASFGGVPMHIHTLQTPHQREYGMRKWGKSLLMHMGDCGIVDENLVLGHAVYLTEEDIALLADRGASTTHHASCNLIMRNGIAPVMAELQAGVNVALGMDEKQINDGEDALMEMRMIYYLHRMNGYELDRTPAMTPAQALSIGTVNGAKTIGLGGSVGTLDPGMQADVITVDLKPILEEPWSAPDADILQLFIHRAMGGYVRNAVAAGKLVMKDRKILTVDEEALYREVRAYMDAHWKSEKTPYQKNMARVKEYYHRWNAGRVPQHPDVYYQMNSRK